MNHLTIKKAKLLTASLAATLATGTVFAEPGTLSESPLFLSDAVEPNVIMALDDSGSMDFETLLPTNDASLWWNTADQSFIGRDINDNPAPGVLNFNRNGGNNANWRKYTQLFPNGYANGNASLGGANGRFPVPPIVEFGYVRSSFYNPGYYDHTITYEPWVDTGLRTFNDSNPTNAPWDPITNATTFTIDLTQDFFRDTDDGWRFYTVPGMRDGDGNPTVTAMYDAYRYFLPTYFVPDSTLTLSAGGIPIDCAAPNPANYGFFYLNATALTGTADAVGPDGQCLRRVEIRPTTPSFPSGRTYAEEIQNFANYFTYYRKRHHALRAGVTQALDSIGAGVRVGTFRFNNRQPVTMRSLTTDYDDVLDDIFTSRGNGGTPTRDSLIYAGEQFRRTDANAPITHACQKNYGIVFTDGFATLTNNAVNNVDGTAGVPFADNVDDTLGDIAMEYYNNLNMTGFASGQVPTPIACAAGTDPTLDCNSDLHMTTYGVTLNSTGTIFNVTHFDVADAHANPPTWPDPLPTRSPQMVDDLYHAAVNGRGEMLNARTPLDIATQMTEVLKAVVETEGTAAAVTFNTGLLSSDSLVYQAKLDSEEWSGFVTASALDPVTGAVATTPSWDAADLIPLENNRQISTFDPTTGGIPFRNLASLTANQAADMATDLPPTMTAQDMVDYLRGARTNESETLFRQRAARTVLGDIVHSSPVLVGAPRSGWPNAAPFPTGTDAYGNFETAQASRREAVYVGANDGMLHGIWADVGQSDSGVEFMGYIPNALFSSVSGEGLHELAQQDYTHKYFVDLTPTVTDAYVRTTASGSPDWATVLVGGLRGGGRGMFALDVTDPTVMSESDAGDFVMWEFTDADDADLGFAFSEPTISLMNNGQWAAVFGNGYNSTGSTNAYLFIVFLEGGLDRTWTLGSDYIKIELPGAANGLGTPQLADLDGNGTPDRAYAGDLYGNMWAFDLSSSNTNAWQVDYTNGSTPVPLFTAINAAGDVQPITSKPILARCPYDNSVSPDVMVLFGTGQYLIEGDKTTSGTQTFYGIWDRGDDELERVDLLEQFANDPSLSYDTTAVRVPTDFTMDPLTQFGWYMDLPDAGERVVSNPLVRGGIAFFNTIIPDAGDPCVVGGGGWLMSVDICDGSRPDEPAFDLNRDNVVNNGDLVADTTLTDASGNPITNAPGGERFNPNEGLPWQSSVLGDRQYTPGSTGNIETRTINVSNNTLAGRLSWEQLINE